MRAIAVKQINNFIQGLQEASGMSDKRMKNVRRNLKRLVTRSNLPTLESLLRIDINRLIKRSEMV